MVSRASFITLALSYNVFQEDFHLACRRFFSQAREEKCLLLNRAQSILLEAYSNQNYTPSLLPRAQNSVLPRSLNLQFCTVELFSGRPFSREGPRFGPRLMALELKFFLISPDGVRTERRSWGGILACVWPRGWNGLGFQRATWRPCETGSKGGNSTPPPPFNFVPFSRQTAP